MNQSDQTIFSGIVKELDETNEANCAVKVSKILELLAKLAREHWLRRGKEDLWHASQKIWLDLRELAAFHARKTDPDVLSTYNWVRTKASPELRDLIFLAEVASHSAKADFQQKARVELKRLLLESRAKSSPVYGAIEIIHELLPRQSRPTRVPDPQPTFEFFDAPDHDLPTLTRRRGFGQSDLGVLSVQIGFPEPPDLHELLLEVHRGDEGAIFRILEKFDSTDSPRVKNSCVEALRLIGGCVVSQELSARVSANPLYAQCLVLCALDGLASQPYRPPSDQGETLSLQHETVRTVLNRLLEFEPHSEDLLAIRASAISGVQRHKEECGAR